MLADARKNRDHLLAVAGAVITEQGADASMRDIARRADVGLATLLRHLPAREALFEARRSPSLVSCGSPGFGGQRVVSCAVERVVVREWARVPAFSEPISLAVATLGDTWGHTTAVSSASTRSSTRVARARATRERIVPMGQPPASAASA